MDTRLRHDVVRLEHGSTAARQEYALMIGVRDALTARIAEYRKRPRRGGKWIHRLTVPIPGVNVMGWLSNQSTHPQWYWSARNHSFESASIGVAHRILARVPAPIIAGDVLELAADILERSDPGVKYFGGMSFGSSINIAEEWDSFGDVHLIIPRIEVWRGPEGAFLSCQLRDDDRECADDALAEFISKVTFSDDFQDAPLQAPVSRDDRPTKQGWVKNITSALQAFASGELEKIVLARESIFHFSGDLHPLELLSRLKRVTPDCYHFCVNMNGAEAFLGASPERLYSREGRAVLTEAVAGTRPRGVDDVADTAAGKELLESEKDQREHAFVRDAIMQALKPLTDEVDIDESPSLLRLARGQHLFSAVRGQLCRDTGDAQLMAALHPTPAVGGTPRNLAVKRIEELEPFCRGWYAGPVGWISQEASEFAVAIRSALVAGDQLSLFSGAGIVQGSTAESEWLEIENKIADFIKILTTS